MAGKVGVKKVLEFATTVIIRFREIERESPLQLGSILIIDLRFLQGMVLIVLKNQYQFLYKFVFYVF